MLKNGFARGMNVALLQEKTTQGGKYEPHISIAVLSQGAAPLWSGSAPFSAILPRVRKSGKKAEFDESKGVRREGVK
ncbi:MAG TPA: hypothetical protein PK587_09770 [Syntrophales bacterium]|nr:hypothetical protein [Syntrophales bacterium]